jgi:hypothetical protein
MFCAQRRRLFWGPLVAFWFGPCFWGASVALDFVACLQAVYRPLGACTSSSLRAFQRGRGLALSRRGRVVLRWLLAQARAPARDGSRSRWEALAEQGEARSGHGRRFLHKGSPAVYTRRELAWLPVPKRRFGAPFFFHVFRNNIG